MGIEIEKIVFNYNEDRTKLISLDVDYICTLASVQLKGNMTLVNSLVNADLQDHTMWQIEQYILNILLKGVR